jgi:integrase
MADLSPLRRRMIEDMTVRNLSPATQRSYISAVSKLSRYFGRSPDRLELEDVRAFQVHLVSTGISWPALNQIVCALRFFYGVTLGEALIPERIPYARQPLKLPVVLSADEVVQFLEAVSSLKSRAALTTAYAAGLRASEVAGLRIEDIDSARGVIRVRHGKGAKDRNAVAPTARHPAHLLAARPAAGLSVPWSRRRSSDRSDRVACRLPVGGEGCGPDQARHAAYVAPQLRDTSSGERNRHPDHPGSARAQ